MGEDADSPFGWTFAKLTGPSTWSDWSRNMRFALMSEGLWRNVNGDRPIPKSVESTAKKLDDWESRDAKACETIGLMCHRTVRMQLTSIWTARETWDYLRKMCIPSGWYHKWKVMSKVEHLSLAKCRDMADFRSQLGGLEAEIDDLNITIEDYLVIKAVNSLDRRFKTWITNLEQQARDSEDGKLPDLDTIFQSLQLEEHRQKIRNEQINLARGGRGQRGRGRGRGGGQDHNHEGNNHTGNQKAGGGRGESQGRGRNRGRGGDRQERTLPPGVCEQCRCRHENSTCDNCRELGHGWRCCKQGYKGNRQNSTAGSSGNGNTGSTQSTSGTFVGMIRIVDKVSISPPPQSP